jgi:hypothetical protein
MKFTDNLWLVNCDHSRRIYQFAQYAAHLCTGETIQMRAIRYSTVCSYLLAAASFLQLKCHDDPRFELGATKYADPIKKVLDEYKRWEAMPNRREPWTIEMQQAFDKANEAIAEQDKDDTLPLALADWFALGLSTGYRRGEWAQPNEQHAGIHKPDHKNWGGIIPAMLPRDFVFYDTAGKKLSHAEAVSRGIRYVARVKITWRVQKNKQNNESKTYIRNLRKQDLCPVYRALRIVARHIRVVGPNQPTVPLGVHKHPENGARLIIAREIEKHMRIVVAKILNLDPEDEEDAKELLKWSAHSLRVGACQILYACGFNAHEIQTILRWLSLAFMDYLRDIAWVARKQIKAVNTVADDVIEPFL